MSCSATPGCSSPGPSREVALATDRVVSTSRIVGMDLATRVIVGDGKYASMKERSYV
jgi:DNA repair protein RadC